MDGPSGSFQVVPFQLRGNGNNQPCPLLLIKYELNWSSVETNTSSFGHSYPDQSSVGYILEYFLSIIIVSSIIEEFNIN